MSELVLFDAPGPKARRRHGILTIIGIVIAVVIAWLVVRKMGEANQLDGSLWSPFVTDKEVWTQYLLPGLWGTIKAAALSVVFAGILGLLLGSGRLSSNRWLRGFCGAVVEFFRSVPVLIMMVFAYFGYFATSDLVSASTAPLAAVVLALTLYNGAVIAELVRSGVFSLPKGQAEAGLSIGLSPAQTLRAIQLPQALTAMLPALVGQLVVVLKDTALGVVITYPELLNAAKTLGSSYANTVPAYIVAALIFIIINYALTRVAAAVERWLKSRGQGPQKPGTAGITAAGVPGPEESAGVGATAH